MDVGAILSEAYERIGKVVGRAVEGLDDHALTACVEPGTNSIAWLVWHLTRVQDDHVADLTGQEQVWTAERWHERFDGITELSDTGQGYSREQMEAVRPHEPSVLLGYHEAVARRSQHLLESVTPADLDRIIDRSYDPPVTMGVRLVSILNDNLQHAGQAVFVRGILERRA